MATTAEIQDQIIEVYIAAFNRAPDAAGLAYWVDNVVNNSWSIDDVASSFFDSEEVTLIYPNTLSNEAFLDKVYNNVLGRAGDDEGVDYWVDQMNNGIQRNEMITTIINGAKADSGDANDKLFLDNKKEVAEHFAVTLELDDVTLAKSVLTSITSLHASTDEAKDLLDIYKTSLDTTLSLIQGDETDNTLNGTDETNHIYSFAGNDVIVTGAGDNIVASGSGTDSIYANSGNDTIYGRADDDTVYADEGDDFIYGNEGNDSLHGEAGDDKVYGNEGDDYLYGDEGNDTLTGGAGDDIISGGAGDDIINGNEGDDKIYADDGLNFVDGGSGNDTIYGGDDIDTLYGGDGADIIYGQDGADIVDGLIGNDIIYGGLGDDIINGNEGDDTLYGSIGADKIDGEQGVDTIYGGAGADIMTGGAGIDTFHFISADSTLVALDIIVDFEVHTDKINFVNQGSEVISGTATDVSTATTLALAADMASTSDGSVNAQVNWFIYEDNTYVVEDLSVGAAFVDSTDIIIQIQGIVNLLGLDTSDISFS